MSSTDQDHLVDNIVGHLGAVTSAEIRKRQVAVFARANKDFAARVAKGVKVSGY
jgi:catalase